MLSNGRRNWPKSLLYRAVARFFVTGGGGGGGGGGESRGGGGGAVGGGGGGGGIIASAEGTGLVGRSGGILPLPLPSSLEVSKCYFQHLS